MCLLLVVLWEMSLAAAAETHSVRGLVLKVDRPHQRFTVSCQAIPGFMEAMAMSYPVRDPKELERLAPGVPVDFTLVVEGTTVYAQHIQLHRYQSVEQDPLAANRLRLLDNVLDTKTPAVPAVEAGENVPDFALTDQKRQLVSLSQFSGKLVLVNFMYTRCTLPQFCLRVANHFGVLQRRFKSHMGRDLVFLTITFDPTNDTPEILAKYADTWKADPAAWHFLSGSASDVGRVCNLFGVAYYPNEGFMDHTLHTAIVSPSGKLFTNLEGNDFTAEQLGDMVETMLDRQAAQ
jgi:protein SCO1/2